MVRDGMSPRAVRRYLMSNMWDKELIDELKGRHVLHWNYRRYEQLPLELMVFGMHVEEIYLKGNSLTVLPDWVHSLSHLTNLYLEDNGLAQLPPAIGSCSMLDTLDLQDNRLDALPDEFCNLKNLTTLNLRGNRIKRLPKGFGNLKALALLNMTGNALRVLPESVSDLRSLQELILDNNELKELPKQIVQLPNLCYLSVRKNDLERLPLMFFVNHASVTFTHNPKLNYLQYELGCDLSRNSFVATDFDDDEGAWRMDITGCATENPEPNDTQINIKIEKDDAILKLPREFQKLHNHNSSSKLGVASLFELALRQSYETIGRCRDDLTYVRDTVEWSWNIPSIGRFLRGGPTARCSNVDCSEALFTEAVVWAMRMHVTNGEGPTRTLATLLFFCSGQCSLTFGEKHEREGSLRVKWNEV